MSIAAAIQWALESNLQGLVLDSGAVQEQSQAVATARSKGLKVSQPSATATVFPWHSIAPLPGLRCSSCSAIHDAFRCCVNCFASFDTQPCHMLSPAIPVGGNGSVRRVMGGLPCRC